MHADRIRHLGLAVIAALSLTPRAADAFCRTRTTPVPAAFDPSTTDGCFDQGLPLYRPSQCVPYRLLAVESPIVPNAVISSSLARAFGTWTSGNAFCTPGLTPIELAPSTETTIVGYTKGQRENNLVGVVNGSWPHADDGAATLALATLTFNVDSGEIYDADLEIRSDGVKWSFGATPPADGFDFDAVITHETGHLLGLAHSAHAEAVMFASYTPGSTTQRVLSDDDKQGICAIYPDRQTRSTSAGNIAATLCNLAPGDPNATPGTCGDPVVGHGCSVTSTPAQQSGRVGGLTILTVASALLVRARTRRR